MGTSTNCWLLGIRWGSNLRAAVRVALMNRRIVYGILGLTACLLLVLVAISLAIEAEADGTRSTLATHLAVWSIAPGGFGAGLILWGMDSG